jgi:hypothetical protein
MIALPGVAGVTFVMSGREACGTVGSPFHMVLQYIVRQEKKRAHCKFLAKSLHIFIIDGRTPNRQSVSLFLAIMTQSWLPAESPTCGPKYLARQPAFFAR